MKLYKTTSGILLEQEGQFYRPEPMDWDQLVNRDGLYSYLLKELDDFTPVAAEQAARLIREELQAPIGQQEVWAAGVTYAAEVRTHNGATYQALRDTGTEPGSDDWICLASAGRDGRDALEIEVPAPMTRRRFIAG